MTEQGPGRRLVDRLTGRSDAVRPPELRTDDNRSASKLELFFDLAFVLVLTELAKALREDVTVHGYLVFAGLFGAVWWSWVSSTLYANRFDHDDVVYRVYKLASMAAVVGLAASASEATGERATVFVVCQLVLRGLLLLQYRRAHVHVPDARPITRLYLTGAAAGAAFWAVSLAVPRPAAYAFWLAAVLVEALVPLLATRTSAEVPVHVEHLPERFALFVILVLGEPVAAVAHGLYDAKWTANSVVVAALAFVLAAALWWSYFDLAGARAKRLLDESGEPRATHALDVYVFGHLPLTLALATVGAGIELAVVEAGDVPPGTRLLVAGGVALYLASASVTASAMTGDVRRGWWWPLAAAVVAGLDALLDLPAVAVIGALAALVVVVVVAGSVQRATGQLEAEEV
ncbi:low temperature requirement protein A [Geodermatophilus nigrescens]|uniref:Low temperature requirement protein LtrA n=1 Tax=Geodermatophilus nigrescens TaxID=1070870 RepID=A0A1M5IGS3_9ACTN|nr:low temperature requirement protein A [Geodermatophilus nigrescens]SHG27150.1 Low temperature requirement protein LtrA [Geodermatophilus nigrescens]